MRMDRIVSALSLFCLAGTVIAEPPAALDRVPKGAVVAVGVRSVSDSMAKIEKYAAAFGLPTGPLVQMSTLTDAEGFNKAGSAAFAMLGDPASPDFSPDTNGFVIVSVTDFSKFVNFYGGKIEDKQGTLPKLSEDALARDIGGGFAAVGPAPAIKAFVTVEGQMAAHKAALGAAGNRIADQADILVISNLEPLSGEMLQGVEEIKGSLEMAGQMVAAQNPEAEKSFAAVGKLMEQFAKEVRTGIMGMTVNDAGISVDFAAQFKDGSDMHKKMQHDGKAGLSAAGLPAMPFLLAGGVDMTCPVIRDIVSSVGAMQQGMGINLGKGMEKIEGQAFMIGANPALLSTGIFARTVVNTRTSDPTAVVAAQREAIEGMAKTGQEAGVKYDLKYTPEATEIAGVKVDRWKAKIDIDPDSPAAQMQQVMAIFTGSSGEMGGMSAKTKNSVVSTMSVNTEMMTKAIDAANGKGALSGDAAFAAVAAQLAPNRTAEMYLGVKGIFDTVKGAASSFNADIPFNITEELPPIGMAITTDGGGVSFRIHAPAKVVEAIAKIVKQMETPAEGDAPEPEKNDGERRKPRF